MCVLVMVFFMSNKLPHEGTDTGKRFKIYLNEVARWLLKLDQDVVCQEYQ
jgi:hypothetical protein